MGGVLALAMIGNMVVASVAGAGVPLLLRRLRMDPEYLRRSSALPSPT